MKRRQGSLDVQSRLSAAWEFTSRSSLDPFVFDSRRRPPATGVPALKFRP